MKLMKYQVMHEHNCGTEEEPVIVQSFYDCEIRCADECFEANYAIALSETHNGEITVEDIPDPETEPSQEEDTAAMLVDHEYRLTLLELGLVE